MFQQRLSSCSRRGWSRMCEQTYRIRVEEPIQVDHLRKYLDSVSLAIVLGQDGLNGPWRAPEQRDCG